MVYAEHYYRVMRDYIEKNHLRDDISGKNIVIEVPKGEVSKVSGQKRANKLRLQNEYNVKNVVSEVLSGLFSKLEIVACLMPIFFRCV